MYAGIGFFLRERDHVLVDLDWRHDFLPFHDPFHRPKLIAERRRPLKVQRVRRFHHLLSRIIQDSAAVPAEEIHQVLDILAVLFAVHLADTRRVTQLDVVIQAGALILSGNVAVTGQVRESLAQNIERFPHRPRCRVRPKIAAAILLHAPRKFHFREIVGPAHGDVRVALIVLEPDVEMRSVLLDQVIFGVQRRDLAGQHEKFNVRDLFAQPERFRVKDAVIEITPHAAAQIHSLPDVDHLARLVFHEVTAGLVRQIFKNRLNMLSGHKRRHRQNNLPNYKIIGSREP